MKLLSDVLFPGRVESYQIWEEMSPHGPLNHVGTMEVLSVMVSFHSSAGALDVLTVVLKDSVELFILIRDAFPVDDHCCPIEDSSKSEKLRKRVEPSFGLPSDIPKRVLDESEEVLEGSTLVGFINWLLAQPELLELPIVLLSHGSRLWIDYL